VVIQQNADIADTLQLYKGTLSWQPFLSSYIWGIHWRRLENTTEPSVCGGSAASCQITLIISIFS